jgi:hypothetical protein
MSEREPKMVSILKTGNAVELTIVRSLFQSAEIPFTIRGDGVQDLFALGRLGGFNPLTGPAIVEVPEDYADDARALLASHTEGSPDED